MKAVLGLKLDYWHDTGAALIVEKQGKLFVSAISQERLNHEKNSREFPKAAIDYCLNEQGLTLDNLSLVVSDFIVDPTHNDKHQASPAKLAFFKTLEQKGIPFVFSEHHLCHIASAFYSTPWDDAVGMVVDGHGSRFESQTLFSCTRTGITKFAQSHRCGLGMAYAQTSKRINGFGHLQEGKTMGLAGWGQENEEIDKLYQKEGYISSLPLETHYSKLLRFDKESEIWTSNVSKEVIRRDPETTDALTPPYPEYAYAAQKEVETQLLEIAKYARKICPGPKRLCYAGGVGLNIPANRGLIDSGLFDEVFIQPACSDSGIPLGAALLGYYTMLGGTIRWDMKHAFLAKEYPQDELAKTVTESGLHVSNYDAETVAKILDNNYLAAWFDGASEYGPRALGHRSILCNPRHKNMKAYLNAKVKFREMFRPFAPIVAVENQSDFFDLKIPSPFMLINAEALPEKRDMIPAVVHADGTARVQSVAPDILPKLHDLLKQVEKLNGAAVLLNTSLNLAGEPIVETPADTLDLFERSNLDILVMGDKIASKKPLEELLAHANKGLEEVETAKDLMTS